ncbi:hypothetical protein NL676_010413 [Syzygium grande]|nr:hypothetical protein NL676_010413 [Syzygium grande]
MSVRLSSSTLPEYDLIHPFDGATCAHHLALPAIISLENKVASSILLPTFSSDIPVHEKQIQIDFHMVKVPQEKGTVRTKGLIWRAGLKYDGFGDNLC